jgi:O-Antigen ligase/Tetratricopeptide repeat
MWIGDTPVEASVLRRPADAAGVAIASQALLACALIACGAASGGYFPTSWGWLALGFGWSATVALTLRRTTQIQLREVVYLAAFAALTVWTWVSTAWSPVGPETVLEGLRTLMLPLAIAVVILVATRGTAYRIPSALLAATSAVSLYALATRLLPDRLGVFDPSAGYRLSAPVGYWNGLGIFAALGVLLAVGLAARADRPGARSLAAASLLVLVPTLYFTFSRGAWAALAIGLAVAVAVDPRRLQLLATIACVAPAPALGIYLASHSHALTHTHPQLAEAAREGHRLGLGLLVLALLSAGAVLLLAALERQSTVGHRLRSDLTLLLAVGVVAAGLVGIGASGGPVTLAHEAGHAFTAAPAPEHGSLNRRLLDLSGNGRVELWRAALADFEAHPLLGSGAGSYEQYWLLHRPTALKVRDAHNLYLETAAELGLVGLALLLAGLAMPLVALRRTRRHPLVPALAGAYCAYLVHAAFDWDWEVPAVTLSALLCGAAILVVARTGSDRKLPSRVRVGGLAAVVVALVVAFVGLVGNIELSRAGDAARRGSWSAAAADARLAHKWAPFSAAPWQQLGEAETAIGQDARAQASLRRAIAISPNDWTLWFDLARASTGGARTAALSHARMLNPLSPEVREFERELDTETPVHVE